MLNRINDSLADSILPESQCGFQSGRDTADMVFAARQIQEKCREQHKDIYFVFIDLTKAFNTVSRDGLWKILTKHGCPDKFVNIIKSFHLGMQVRVLDQGSFFEPFSVTNGVKQGCVLAPLCSVSCLQPSWLTHSNPQLVAFYAVPRRWERLQFAAT